MKSKRGRAFLLAAVLAVNGVLAMDISSARLMLAEEYLDTNLEIGTRMREGDKILAPEGFAYFNSMIVRYLDENGVLMDTKFINMGDTSYTIPTYGEIRQNTAIAQGKVFDCWELVKKPEETDYQSAWELRRVLKEAASEEPAPSQVPKPSETVKPSEQLKPSSEPEPSEAVKPSEGIKPSSEPNPSENIKPSSEPKPSETVKPSSGPKPSESIKPSSEPNPSEAVKPSESVKPSEGPKPSESIKPSEEPNPSEAVKPSENVRPSTKPSEAVKPSNEPKPSENVRPSIKPSEAVKPSNEPKPSESVSPSNEPKPSESIKPSEEPKPSEALQPSESAKPSNRPKPSEALQPSGNVKSSEEPKPGESVKPNHEPKPSQGVKPGQTSAPGELLMPNIKPIQVSQPERPFLPQMNYAYVQSQVSSQTAGSDYNQTLASAKAVKPMKDRAAAATPDVIDTIIHAGTYNLQAGTVYTLGSALKLEGDVTEYAQGIQFQVNTGGNFTFR